jgi:hypothetical protein
MQELTYAEINDNSEKANTPAGQPYRPPVFKKDFFDNLIRNENKRVNDSEVHLEDKERDEKPAPVEGIVAKVMAMFVKKVDISVHKVSKHS